MTLCFSKWHISKIPGFKNIDIYKFFKHNFVNMLFEKIIIERYLHWKCVPNPVLHP